MNPEDPFALVRISNKPLPGQPGKTESTISPNDPFKEVRLKKAEGFPFLYEGSRHLARVASRIGETIGGIPGDIEDLIQSGIFAGLEKISGIPTPPEAREMARKERLPTSREIKKFSEEATKGFTAPQTEAERSADEFIETATSLFGPMKFRRALGVALAGQGAKEGLKLLGTGETEQEAGKLGTMFLTTMINPGAALKYAESQYNKADKLSKGASIIAKGLETDLNSLRTNLEKGVTTPAKNAVLRPIDDLLAKIKNNKIPVQELTAAKRDINTLMGDPILLKRERKLLQAVGGSVDKAIKPFEAINPPFKAAYRPANEIYGAVQTGNKASNFIKKTLGAKSVLGAVLGEAVLGHPEFIIPTASAAAGAFGGAKTIDFLARIHKSPELRKFYIKAMAAAAAQDAAALRTYAGKLEENLEKRKSSIP